MADTGSDKVATGTEASVSDTTNVEAAADESSPAESSSSSSAVGSKEKDQQSEQQKPHAQPVAVGAGAGAGPAAAAKVGTPHTSTAPEAVGISLFLNDKPGFSAILKQRYEDFHVTEVGPEGKVAKLTEPLVPEDRRARSSTASSSSSSSSSKEPHVDEKWGDYLAGNTSHVRTDLAIGELRNLLGDADAQKVRDFVDNRQLLTVVLSPCKDKATRSRVHAIFRESFHGLVTDTVPFSTDGSSAAVEKPSGAKALTCIRVRRNSRASRQRASEQQQSKRRPKFDDRGTQQQWSGGAGKNFVHFILWKENMDTNRMLSQVRVAA